MGLANAAPITCELLLSLTHKTATPERGFAAERRAEALYRLTES